MTGSIIERMYEDFTNSIVPLIGEGVQITKEYATDFLGRYRTFLIVNDSVYLLFTLSLSFLFAWCIFFFYKKAKACEDFDYKGGYVMVIAVCSVAFIMSIMETVGSTQDLVKSIYVPEVRMYEEFNGIR